VDSRGNRYLCDLGYGLCERIDWGQRSIGSSHFVSSRKAALLFFPLVLGTP
jgi:hypothetical protein